MKQNFKVVYKCLNCGAISELEGLRCLNCGVARYDN